MGGKSIRKFMQLCTIDGSDEVKVPIDPSVKIKRSDCPTQEEIEANPGTHKHRTLLYQKIMEG
jgi:hypothetical protein